MTGIHGRFSSEKTMVFQLVAHVSVKIVNIIIRRLR